LQDRAGCFSDCVGSHAVIMGWHACMLVEVPPAYTDWSGILQHPFHCLSTSSMSIMKAKRCWDALHACEQHTITPSTPQGPHHCSYTHTSHHRLTCTEADMAAIMAAAMRPAMIVTPILTALIDCLVFSRWTDSSAVP
jgi:hypothetical protein